LVFSIPSLQQVGFGMVHQSQSKLIQTAAGLDVIRGRHPDGLREVPYPVVWPADGASVPINEYVGEHSRSALELPPVMNRPPDSR
jgi:hypothetical protein